jgi:hypothetical protein
MRTSPTAAATTCHVIDTDTLDVVRKIDVGLRARRPSPSRRTAAAVYVAASKRTPIAVIDDRVGIVSRTSSATPVPVRAGLAVSPTAAGSTS